MPPRIRESNIEMMRIICMMMILVHHLICHVIFSVPLIMFDIGALNNVSIFAIFLNAFCYIGVNCFILISGYFGIQFKWSGLAKLYFTMLFYAFVQCVVESTIGIYEFSATSFKDIFLVFTNYSPSHWWFMNCYVIFYMLTPLIKLDYLSKSQMKKNIMLLCIVNIYFGYWWSNYTTGFTVAQFLFIYVIGNYLRRFMPKILMNRKVSISLYAISSILFALCVIATRYMYVPHWHGWYYNNPLVVFGAIGFFSYMLTFRYNSLIINRLAVSAVGLYLLQNMSVFRLIFSKIDEEFGPIQSNFIRFLYFIIIFCCIFYIISVIVDSIRLLFLGIMMRGYEKFSINLKKWFEP